MNYHQTRSVCEITLQLQVRKALDILIYFICIINIFIHYSFDYSKQC